MGHCRGWRVGAVVWGERTAGAAVVAVGKRTVEEQRCQRCCGDIAVGVVGGEIARRHREIEWSAPEIDGGGDDAGVGEAVVSWP